MKSQTFYTRRFSLVRFASSGLLVIEAAIAATAISAIASTQPHWIGSRQAAAAAVTVPSTSAKDLGQPLRTNCQPTREYEEKPSFCGGVGPDAPESDSTEVTPTPVKPIQIKPQLNCTPPEDGVNLICLPVPMV